MFRVLLIRPGATDYDHQRRIKGRLDIPLNREGADQVAQIVRQLSHFVLDIVYAAPCRSAVQTAEAVADAVGAKVKIVPQLQNLNPGLWQGKLIEEVRVTHPKSYRRWQEQPETMCPPEGEMLSEARKRLTPAVERIQKKSKAGVCALVVPEPLARVLGALLKNEEVGDLWQAETNCGSWELIEVNLADLVAP